MPVSPISELHALKSTRTTARGVAVPYDFRRPTKLSREHVRVLQMAYETFARRLTTLLTSGLRQVCEVTVTEIAEQSYDEYISALATTTLMVPIAMAPLPMTGALELSLPVALTAIDYMLGGPGGDQLVRPLTDIETTLVRGLLDQILTVLRYSLDPIIAVEPAAGTLEYNPQFLQIASPADAVVVGTFKLRIGRESCPLTLCLPLGPLAPRLIAQRHREVADADSDAAARVAAQRIRERLADAPVEVSVRFRPAYLDPTRILALEVGDILNLRHRVGTPLTVQAGGVRVARAIPGKSGNNLAALIVDATSDLSKENL